MKQKPKPLPANNEPAIFTKTKNGLLLNLQISTGASLAGVDGIFNNRLKIKVNSQPVDNAANKEVIETLAKFLQIPKSSIIIKSGSKSKLKTVLINGEANEILNLLKNL